jgi:MFS family permease
MPDSSRSSSQSTLSSEHWSVSSEASCPSSASRTSGLASKSAVLSFVAAFGLAKAFANLAAGGLAERVGRKRLLVAGRVLALPVAPMIALAPSWGFVVVANLFLGANQGLAWSMTVEPAPKRGSSTT